MLAIHDCTFQINWANWGSLTTHVERVAADVMLDLLQMSPENIRRLSRSPRELELTSRVAHARIAVILARRKKLPPPAARIVLEIV